MEVGKKAWTELVWTCQQIYNIICIKHELSIRKWGESIWITLLSFTWLIWLIFPAQSRAHIQLWWTKPLKCWPICAQSMGSHVHFSFIYGWIEIANKCLLAYCINYPDSYEKRKSFFFMQKYKIQPVKNAYFYWNYKFFSRKIKAKNTHFLWLIGF